MGSSWKEARLTVAREGMSDGVAGWRVKGIVWDTVARVKRHRGLIFLFTFFSGREAGGLAREGKKWAKIPTVPYTFLG